MRAAVHGKASGRARGRLPWLGRPATTGREPQPRMPCCCRQCVHVACCSRPAAKLESFSCFSLSDLVTLFRMMGRVFAGPLQVVREQPMDAHVQAGCTKLSLWLPRASTQTRASGC